MFLKVFYPLPEVAFDDEKMCFALFITYDVDWR